MSTKSNIKLKLPKGLKNLNDVVSGNYKRSERTNLIKALKLLREMAEGYQYILNRMKLVDNHPFEVALMAKVILTKFKEWK